MKVVFQSINLSAFLTSICGSLSVKNVGTRISVSDRGEGDGRTTCPVLMQHSLVFSFQ